MDFRKQLISEASRANIDLIVSAIDGKQEHFDDLLPFIYDSNGYVATRAGWVVKKCAAQYPELIHPYLNEIMDYLPQIPYGGLRRLMLKVLTLFPPPKERMGRLVNLCLDWLESPNEKVAVKVYSMEILRQCCYQEPDLIPEFLSIIENHYERNSFAFQSRANKIFNEFREYM